MKNIYFTPGPSELYFTVGEHLNKALKEHIASISHRSRQFEDIYYTCVQNLRQLLNIPDEYHIFFLSSATEAWERIAQNLIERESFHFVNGAFSSKFQQIVSNYGKSAHVKEAAEGQVVDVERVLIPEKAELISLTYNETSTGAMHTADDLAKIRSGFPNQLIALDVVSASPAVEIDFSLVDTFYFSVQKCFGLPAGLGVWVVNDRCIQKAQQMLDNQQIIGSHHSIPELLLKAGKNQTPATPNVLNIYLLSKVTGDMLQKGTAQIWQETKYKHAVLNHMVEQSQYLSHFVESDKHRSKTTLVANCSVPSREIIDRLQAQGLVVGSGYGHHKTSQIRIANFPTHSKEQMEMLSDKLLDLNF